jgi:hypothetical protein
MTSKKQSITDIQLDVAAQKLKKIGKDASNRQQSINVRGLSP